MTCDSHSIIVVLKKKITWNVFFVALIQFRGCFFFEFMDASPTIPNTCARKLLPFSLAVYFQCFGSGRTSICSLQRICENSLKNFSALPRLTSVRLLTCSFASLPVPRCFGLDNCGNVHIVPLLETPLSDGHFMFNVLSAKV